MRQTANAGDGCHGLHASIPACGIGANPVDRDDSRANGNDERIRVKDFAASVKTLAFLFRDLTRQERRASSRT